MVIIDGRGGWCCRPDLLHVEGHLNLGDILGDPPLQRPDVDGLAHSSGHGRFDFYSACVGRRTSGGERANKNEREPRVVVMVMGAGVLGVDVLST